MSQYILIFVWLAFLLIISQTFGVYQIDDSLEHKELRTRVEFAIISIIPLAWWACKRPVSFIDTDAYVKFFHSLPNTLNGISAYLKTVNKDKGFSVLSIMIKMLVGDNATLYLLVLALIQLVILALVFRKYSINYLMSLFLFVASTDYLSWVHNSIRQFTAVVLIFAATELMLKKKHVLLILVILVAATIHGSAILMIPIVFAAQGKPWNKKTMVAVILVAVAILYVGKFTNLLDILLSDTQYTNVVSDWQSGGDDGTNPLRVLVYSIPTILSVLGVRYIKAENNPVINMACNMGIFSTILYCLSMATSGIFIGRLPIYCSLYSMGILLPWELDNMFTKESASMLKICTVGGYLIFYFFQTHFVWGII